MDEITDIRERNDLLYLAQSDSHLRTFMPKRSSLLPDLANRLLLEPGVVITDSYFITSAEIANDLKKYSKSLVWQGLRNDLIIPAFRAEGAQTFRENLEQGVMPTTTIGIREDVQEITSRLNAAVQDQNTRKITWPGGVGISFGELMNSQFNRESVDSDSWGDKEKALWKQSRDLREKYLDMGWQREPNPDVTGLRRGTIFTAMAADLGFTGDPIDTAGIISSADKRHRAALRATILWIDELYNYNQANRFNVRSYYPVSSGSGALMTPGLLWQGPSQNVDEPEISSLSHSVTWPSYRMLRSIQPDRLVGLRKGESGETYVRCLKAFHRDPSDDNWEAFKFALSKYAADACAAVGSDVRSGLAVRYVKVGSGITIGLIASAIAGAVVPGLPHALIAASAVSGTLANVYTPLGDLAADVATGRKAKLNIERLRGGNVRMALPSSVNIKIS